jgi:hypothetical protein
MKDQFITLLLHAYWIGRRYEEHKGLFGKENADTKEHLLNHQKAKAYFESEVQNLKTVKQWP